MRYSSSERGSTVATGGIGLGSVMACIVTYANGQDFWWSVIHGIFGWLYLLGWVLGWWV